MEVGELYVAVFVLITFTSYIVCIAIVLDLWRALACLVCPSKHILLYLICIIKRSNVAISGTHTHAGPGGYLQYVVYILTSLGFVPQSFEAIVTAIELSIVQAHENLKPGSIFINQGDLDNGGVNRSPSAYLFNPPEERARYTRNVDTQMTLLKFVDGSSGKSIGAFNWFATHGTSMSRGNKLISGDNKGAAARFFEDWFSSSTNSTSTRQNYFNNKNSKQKGLSTESITN